MKKIIVLIAGLLICGAAFAQKNYPRIPTVDLKTLDGETFSTKQLYNGDKPFVISLWATWCTPCKEELEAINMVYQDWVDELGIKVYAISIDDSRSASKVAPFVRAKGWEFEVLQDINSDFKRALNVVDVPFLCIVNEKQEIVWSHTSYASGGEEEVYEILKQLVEGKDK